MKKTIKTFCDLEVHQLAHRLAIAVFEVSKNFPKEEKYLLTDQIRRSSRSVAVNIAEGWGKRHYESSFKRHLIDAAGSVEEAKAWLLFTREFSYLSPEEYQGLLSRYEVLGAKLFKLHDRWRTFNP